MEGPDENTKIGIVGLGYVGLPLALAFARKYQVVGYDIDPGRIAELSQGRDRTREVDGSELTASTRIEYTSRLEDLTDCQVFIVTVPTPIDETNRPDLSLLLKASEAVGRVIGRGAIVIYESTVYPGTTEEECIPLIEKISGLRFNVDFFAGYSPERINPGDKTHRIDTIVKVTSGSTPKTAAFVDVLYGSVISAGTFRASSIRVAEAAKVIENVQRDLNIALVNELAMIFDRLGIETRDVLDAAGTKWNFLPFRPGLVGGHCIGVDPYYLTHKAELAGHHPDVILAGRRINSGMGVYVVGQLVREMMRRRIHIDGARVLVLGLAFKENCPDIRNTRVIDVVRGLEELNVSVDIHDPWVDHSEAGREYGVKLIDEPEQGAYDAIVLAVAHDNFTEMGAARIRALGKEAHVVYDLKRVLEKADSDLRL